MSTSNLGKESYINLETMRKNGAVVRTPVWFVEKEGALYVITEPGSGKVKRLRRDPHLKIAPCKFNGEVTGEWLSAEARFLDPATYAEINPQFQKKYGIMKFLFELPQVFNKKKAEPAILEIKILPN